MKTYLYTIAGLALGLASCKKSDPPVVTEPPLDKLSACFTVNKTMVDSGEVVEFTNCSKGATSYTWDLGEGGLRQEKNPTFTYTKRGRNNITLFALQNTLQDTALTVVTVGNRRLLRFKVNSFKAKTGAGENWDDDGTGPDIQILFGPASNPTKYQTGIKQDATGAFVLEIPNPVKIWGAGPEKNNSNWSFKVVDIDGTDMVPMTTFGGPSNPFYPSRGVTPIELSKTADWEVYLETDLVE